MPTSSTYIFDLYGTLIDIWTDENDASLWQHMAETYAVYGADYAPGALRESYLRLCREEEEALRRETGYLWPEIRLESVFLRLLREAPRRHRAELAAVEPEQWCAAIANSFRLLSRKRFGLYPHTMETLCALRQRGCRLYLLSNAQRVFTLPEMEVLCLPELFDALYFSSDRRMKKPQPEFLRALLYEQRIDPAAAVMVGNDFSSDMRIAAACGVPAVFLNTDGYPEETLRAESAALARAYGESARPRLIRSGDIRELL